MSGRHVDESSIGESWSLADCDFRYEADECPWCSPAAYAALHAKHRADKEPS